MKAYKFDVVAALVTVVLIGVVFGVVSLNLGWIPALIAVVAAFVLEMIVLVVPFTTASTAEAMTPAQMPAKLARRPDLPYNRPSTAWIQVTSVTTTKRSSVTVQRYFSIFMPPEMSWNPRRS